MTTTTQAVGSAVFWSLLGRAGRFLLGLASSVVVVRGLGDYDYGVFSLLRTVLTFVVVIAGLGLGQSLLRFLPEMRVSGNAADARRIVMRVLAMQTAAWVVLAIFGFAGGRFFERAFGFPDIGLLVTVTIALAIFELTFSLFNNVLNAYYDTKVTSVAGVVSHLVFLGLLAVVIPRGYGVMGVLVAVAAGQAVACAVVLPHVARVVGSAGEGGGGVGTARLFRLSMPFAVIGLLHLIVWRQSETIFLAHFRSAEETGFFDLAYRLPQTILEFVPITIWPVILAGFSEAYLRDPANLNRVVTKYYRALFLITMPVCLLGVALSGRLVPLLFGEAMAPAAIPTQIFFAIFTVSFLATPLSMALYVLEKSHVNLAINAGLAVVNVGLDLLLIPRYGVPGAIVPVALVILVSPVLYRLALRRYVPAVEVPLGFVGRCLAASSPALLILIVARSTDGIVPLVAATVAGLALILFLTKWLKLIGKEESNMLRSMPIPAAGRLLKFLSA